MAQPQGQETAEPHDAAPGPVDPQMLTADVNDNDSAIGDEPDLESTASIGSSIYKFRVENGRTYNAYGDRTYMMPNDEIEKDRLDLQHHLFQMTLGGKLFLSDIDKSKVNRVLDIGTGTGIWAMDYATDHPEAEVIGVDVSPIQPNFVPPNVQFEIDDMEKEWTFTNRFDFIFSRMMTGAISNWVAYIEKCFANTNPGGYLEIEDICTPAEYIDDSGKGTALEQWGNLMLDASIKLSIPLNSVKGVKKIMEDAGYVDVVEKEYKWPLNKWPAEKKMKEIGMWAHEASVSNLGGLTTALFTRGLAWSAQEVEVYLAGVRNDMKNLKIHSYWPIYVITGRKPEAPAAESEE